MITKQPSRICWKAVTLCFFKAVSRAGSIQGREAAKFRSVTGRETSVAGKLLGPTVALAGRGLHLETLGNGQEIVCLEGGAANEAAVYILLAEKLFGVGWLAAAAVENRGLVCQSVELLT